MTLMDVEPETLSLALRLQSEYLEEIRDKKGKSQEGEISDLQLAVQFYKNELATQEQFLSDLALSRSIARAVEADAEVIRRLVSEEEQAAHDRHVAMVLDSPGQCHAEPPAQDVTNAPSTPDSATLERLAALNNYDAVDYDALMTDRLPDEPESSAGAGERAAQPDSASHDSETFGICDSCNDSFRTDSLAHCSCSHNYCCECLNGLFQASLTDEGLFPPRCCRQEIPVDPNFLPPRLIGQFRAKQLEYNCQDRTYCHEPSCSTFVPGQFIRDGVAICVKCYRRTCVRCKGPMHDRDCPQDPEVQEMLRVARENGWQRCYSCGRMVELTYGCNHMTCTCRSEFCYACGTQWKTCECATWDEARLVARANDRVDRNAPAGRVNGQNRAAMVERARQEILDNDECAHETWRSRRGGFECEECGHHLPEFIYECVQCEMLVCRRCRLHRL